MTKSQDLYNSLETKYTSHPDICSYCGQPVSLEQYIDQYEYKHRFCCTECYDLYVKNIKFAPINNKCESAVEQMIFNYLKGTYSEHKIDHNVTDIIPPYELDFVFVDKNIAIEYNGYLHFSDKYGVKRQRKYQLNDKKKKTIMCRDLCWNMITINSSIGLFVRPDLSKQVLRSMKKYIDKFITQNYYGQCVNIIITSDNTIDINEETIAYKKEKC